MCSGGDELQEISDDLLYNTAKYLDPISQRNLFLSSPKLYRRWQLSFPVPDCHWQFLYRSLELLGAILLQGSCYISTDGIYIYPQSIAPFCIINCAQQDQGVQFTEDFVGISKCQIWHRLTALPGLASVNIDLTLSEQDAPEATAAQLKIFARLCFEFLCSAWGKLVFSVYVIDNS